MKTKWLNRKLYSALLILAIFISSFSSIGSTQAFAQGNPRGIQQSGMMEVHQTGLHKTAAAELSSLAPAALMPAASPLPVTVVHVTDTSNGPGGWTPSPASPDPSGIDYWPLTGGLLVSDSEVDENPFSGTKNVFQATTSGTLVSTCSTLSFSSEPSGVAINPNNNHVFFSDDNGVSADRVFELSLGPDGTYCTADDTVTTTHVGTLYGATDAEDVAYGNNTVFVADGVNAEVIDVCSVKPLDSDTILSSVARTGRCVIVHEAARSGGVGAEIAAVLADEGLTSLLAPVTRVTGYDTVVPLARLEDAYLPDVDRILVAARSALEFT